MTGNDASSLQLKAPAALDAEVCPPGSKSLTNRALLLAALARGRTRLSGLLCIHRPTSRHRLRSSARRRLPCHRPHTRGERSATWWIAPGVGAEEAPS